MKVLEINVDDNGMNGIFTLVRNVIRNKPAVAEVDIAASYPFENPANESELAGYGCKVHFVGYAKNRLLKQFYFFSNVRRLVKDGGYSAVHIHAGAASVLIVPALAAKMAGCKKILLHSHATNVDGDHRTVRLILHLLCRRWLKHLGTDFLTCSDLAGKWMYPNVKAENVVMINNGIDLEKFRFSEATRTKFRTDLSLEGKFVVGHVGRFAYQKNHDYLIDVFKAVADREHKAVLLLIGEGDLEDAIRQKVAGLGLSDRVIFYGVSHTVNELFQAMDVFALPSHFEGLPIVGIEAQASGLPCVLSDQITRETDVTGVVDFLPITPEAVSSWADKILANRTTNRAAAADTLRKAGFSIADTVSRIWQLYTK